MSPLHPLTPSPPHLPRQSLWLFNLFRWYAVRYVRRHFHALRLSRGSAAVPATGEPLIFVMNHPSWWDPLVGFVLTRRFPHYRHFAPIESAALRQYRFFARLGFFGVDPSPRGAATFLRTARAVFAEPKRALWVTAQGRFADPRERPPRLRPGVGHVAAGLERGFVVPLAVEYPFWEESKPEALVRFGEPLDLSAGREGDGREWTARIEEALTATQDALAAEAVARDPAAFEVLVSGRAGVGGVYDFWRRAKAWLRGRRFRPEHGERGERGGA